MKDNNRLHYMDSLRGILMLLGVIYHTCLLYTPSASWIMIDPESHSKLYGLISFFTHTFRMQCFFIISGFFCYQTLSRKGVKQMLKQRLPKLFVPLTASVLTLTPIFSYIVYCYRGGSGGFFAQFQANDTLYFFSYSNAVSHLWFLNNLIVYMCIFSAGIAMLRLIPNIKQKLAYWVSQPFNTNTLILLMLIAYLCDTLDSKLNLLEFLTYAPFFLIGTYFNKWPNQFERFITFSTSKTLASISFLAFGVFVRVMNIDTGFFRLLSDCLLCFCSWQLSALSFWYFKRLFHEKKPALSYIANASYTIYLFHLVFIAIIGYWLMQMSINVHVKFMVTTIATTLLTLLVYSQILKRIPILKYAYNGKLK